MGTSVNSGFSFFPEGLGCFFQVRVSLHLKWTHAAAGFSATVFLASPSTPWSSSFIKHSGILCGIKPADGRSDSGGQDLPLEASNSNCFSPVVSGIGGRSALAEPKCWISDFSSRTRRTCFLICLTPPILLANVAVIFQQLQKLLEWHLSPLPPRGDGGEGLGRFPARAGQQRPQEPPEAAPPAAAPATAAWWKWVSFLAETR